VDIPLKSAAAERPGYGIGNQLSTSRSV